MEQRGTTPLSKFWYGRDAHIRANGPRAVIQELFATYGGKMSSSQAARHSKTSETAKRAQKHIHTCSDNVA